MGTGNTLRGNTSDLIALFTSLYKKNVTEVREVRVNKKFAELRKSSATCLPIYLPQTGQAGEDAKT
jgi:hypothetical protein